MEVGPKIPDTRRRLYHILYIPKALISLYLLLVFPLDPQLKAEAISIIHCCMPTLSAEAILHSSIEHFRARHCSKHFT